MTNKTEMVSVPRELLKRLAANGYAQYLAKIDHEELTALLASPAEDVRFVALKEASETLAGIESRRIERAERLGLSEDVRAVGDEPVAWVVDWVCDGEKYCVVEPGMRAERILSDPDFKATPLYRRPQRQVVLPERQQWCGMLPTAENLRGEGWNACLDEIERLNK